MTSQDIPGHTKDHEITTARGSALTAPELFYQLGHCGDETDEFSHMSDEHGWTILFRPGWSPYVERPTCFYFYMDF